MKKWMYYVLGALALIVLIVFLVCTLSNCKKLRLEAEKRCDAITLMEDLHKENGALKAENARLKAENDSLQLVIDGLVKALADCQGQKPEKKAVASAPKKVASPASKKTAPAPVVVKAPEPVVMSTPEPKKEDFSKEKAALLTPTEEDDNRMYDPVFQGAVGNTLYDNGYLAFYFSDKLYKSVNPTIDIPEFNVKGGAPFTKEGDYWVYRSRIKGKIGGYMNWCAYIGKNAEYNFDMFLPHEWQKKGTADVKALIKAGSVRPNGNTKADGVTEGWEFYLPVYAKVR